MLLQRWRGTALAVLLITSTASSARAQNYSFDARRIALGGAGGTPNVASKLVERQRRYKSILIPVGLVKVLSDVRVFWPNREDFDFSRAVEYGTSPLHFVFGRSEDITARSFFRDMIKAQLQSDLNAYRGEGFEPPLVTSSEGLMAMTWGYTFKLHEGPRSFQAIYVGAGPYLAAQAHADFDGEFEKLLNSETDRYVRSATMAIGGGETNQLALEITGSYRARFPFFAFGGPGSSRNGMYVVANYHHLQGFRFDRFNANLQLDTDENGLLIPNPPETPFTLEWDRTSKGVGLSLDFGLAFVINRWDFGAGVSGVENRIKWRDIERRELALVSFFNNTEFIYTRLPRQSPDTQIELPVSYTGDLSYHRDSWSAYSEYSKGLGGENFRLGLEYRLGAVELRGAGRYSQGSWYPSVGAGFNVTRTFGIDAALFGTRTFLEPNPHLGLAISLRFDKGRTTDR
jgi:hypothetical protein